MVATCYSVNMAKQTNFLTARLNPQTAAAFREKAKRYGGVSEVLRELVEAFIEDRLVIQPPVNPKKESLYVARSQD